MALLTVRPSRGTVAFFVLLGLGLTGRHLFAKREQSIVERDAPLAHGARRVLRCVVGQDADRLLWPRPAGDDSRLWAAVINRRLSLMVTQTQQTPGWPRNCVPIAQRLAQQLAGSSEGTRAYPHSVTALRFLTTLARSSDDAITVADNGSLGTALADMSIAILAASAGAEVAWTSQLPNEFNDLRSPVLTVTPVGQALPRTADGLTFAAPDWLLYQDATDRRAHALLFREQRVTDVVLGPGAPLRVLAGRDATLFATDEADDLLTLDVARPQPVALPEPLRDGRFRIDQWQSVRSGESRWFAAISTGQMRLWSTPTATAQWVERSRPETHSEALAGIALLPLQSPPATPATRAADPLASAPQTAAPEGVTAFVLRHGARGVFVEQWDHTLAPDPTAPSVLLSQPVRRTTLLSETRPLVRPEVRSCVSGSTAHFVVLSDDWIVFYRVHNGRVDASDMPTQRVGARSTGRLDFSCSGSRALLLVDLVGRVGAMVLRDETSREPQLLPFPLPQLTATRSIDAAVLVHQGVLSIQRTPGSIRAFIYARDRWTGGSLLATQEPPTSPTAESPNTPQSPGYSLAIHAISAFGTRVAVLGLGQGRLVRAVRLASDDGGVTWH
ncbi:MAG: hypothetical protein Q8Q09_13550 [Deltaproteobacteria bacterium]|nr:hypothetical protein [Deltaproteobacteria bacterium]